MIAQKITPRAKTVQCPRNATHCINLGMDLGLNLEIK